MVAILLGAAVALTHAAHPDPLIGTWMNHKGTVAVTTSHCGTGICGRVTWAASEAEDAARQGGTPRLVGTELMHDFRPASFHVWEGQVFVPDLGQTADAQMTLLKTGELRIDGCEFGGFLCKTQIWHKVPLHH